MDRLYTQVSLDHIGKLNHNAGIHLCHVIWTAQQLVTTTAEAPGCSKPRHVMQHSSHCMAMQGNDNR
jgi:hypothetical protein